MHAGGHEAIRSQSNRPRSVRRTRKGKTGECEGSDDEAKATKQRDHTEFLLK